MNVFDLVAKLSLDTSEYEGKLSGISASVGKIGKFVASGVAAGTAAVTAFGGASVKTGMDFDSSMSQVAATMGKTVEEISDLRDFAQEMGSTTSFSATQSADALNYMALAGYDAEKSMKMLPNVLNLAAAGGIELAQASDMVTDAQSALGLDLEETTKLVDKMAMASSKSNTSVAQLGDAILTIGGTAKNVAGGTTELTTALGILADNGIKGAEGGTALRNIVLSLSAPTDKAAKAMKALGLEAYDADGNLRPLNDIFNDLNGTLSTMTQGEQTQALNEIFNKVDLKSVNALLANSGERFDELSGYIDKAKDSAQKMADTQLDNLDGDITLMQSAFEGVQIAVSDMLTPSLRQFVQLGSKGLSDVAEALNKGDIGSAFETIGKTIGEGISKVVDMLPQAIEAGSKLFGSVLNGLVAAIPSIVEAIPVLVENLGAILLTVGETIMQFAPSLIESGTEMVRNIGEGFVEGIPEFFSNVLPKITEISGRVREKAGELVDVGLEFILHMAEGIANGIPQLVENIPTIISNIAGIINDNAPKILETGFKIIVTLIEGIIKAIPVIIENIPQIIKAIVDVMEAFNWVNLGEKIIKFFSSGITGMVGTVKNAIVHIKDAITGGIKGIIDGAIKWGKDLIDNFISGITSKLGSVGSAIGGVASKIASFIHFSEPDEGPLSNFHTFAPDMIDLFVHGIRDNENKLREQMESSFDFGTVGAVQYAGEAVARPNYADDGSNINVNITLAGDADGIFRVVKQENTKYKKSNGVSAFA